MNEVLSPQQIAQEAKSAYQAGEFATAAQSFEAARQGYLSADNFIMAAEMANNCSVALLQAGDKEGAWQRSKARRQSSLKTVTASARQWH